MLSGYCRFRWQQEQGLLPYCIWPSTPCLSQPFRQIGCSGMMALALVSCVGAMVLVGPRVYYAMAQDKLFFTHAARLHPVWKTPANAIVWQTIVSILMLLTGSFESLIYYIGFALILFAALAAAGLFRVRRRPGW